MKDAVKDWRDILLAFRVKVDKKYSKSLVGSGSGNWVKDASKKVIWLKEKEDILDLKRKLRLASDTITILTLAAIGYVSVHLLGVGNLTGCRKSNRLAESNIACRVQAVHCLLEQSKKLAEEHVTQLKIIDKEIELHSKTSDLILGNVKSCIMIL
jgi:hypothetical protein